MDDRIKQPPDADTMDRNDIDDALADSFPASDPPSHSVPTTPSAPVRKNPETDELE